MSRKKQPVEFESFVVIIEGIIKIGINILKGK
jgi:hypothetical protein